jgi:hypothetical protein
MSNQQAPHDGQAQLTDLDYNGYLRPKPPAERVTTAIDTSNDLYACGEGDVLWIDGTEYVVLTRNFGVSHRPLTVVSLDGTQGRLIGGTLSRTSTTAGVAWTHDLPSDDDHAPKRSDLLATFDRVYRLERNRLDLVHAWTPDIDQRECPACDVGRSGEPLRIEQQASRAVELRQCTNTDCKQAYRFVRSFPTPETTTLLISADSDDDSPLTTPYLASETVTDYSLSGVFRCTEQDDFKFPLETTDGRDDGFWTASEVAAFCNPKLEHDDPDERFGVVTVTTNDRTGGTVVQWHDKPGARAMMTVTFDELVGGTTAPSPNYGRSLRWNLTDETFASIVDPTADHAVDAARTQPKQLSRFDYI